MTPTAVPTKAADRLTATVERVDGVLEGDLITIVIPVRNEKAFIGPCLRSVLDQPEQNLQIIVVDGASADGTAEIVREFARSDPRIELISNPERTIPKSLNLALRHARGRWFVRVDGHATVPPGYVARVVQHLQTGRWGGVGGRKDGVGRSPAGQAVAAAMASRFGVGNSTYHHGTRVQVVDHIPFGAYPTALLRQLGGWDQRLRVNQDFELDYRVRQRGYQLLFDPELKIAWHCRQSVRDLFSQYRRYGSGKAVVTWIHPGSIKPRHLAAPMLVAALASGVAVSPWSRWPLLLSLTAYLVGLGTASMLTARQLSDLKSRLLVPPAFAAMHLGWGIGYWLGVLRLLHTGKRRESLVLDAGR